MSFSISSSLESVMSSSGWVRGKLVKVLMLLVPGKSLFGNCTLTFLLATTSGIRFLTATCGATLGFLTNGEEDTGCSSEIFRFFERVELVSDL